MSNPNATLSIVKPDGTILTGSSISINNHPAEQPFFLDTQTLATVGTYKLWVQHGTNNFGSETLKLSSVPPDFTGTLTIGGPSVPVPATGSLAPGQNGYLTFSGTQGQHITIHVSNNTINPCYVVLFDPGNNFMNAYPVGGSPTLDQPINSLPSTGTYTIKVDPQGPSTGSMTIALTTP